MPNRYRSYPMTIGQLVAFMSNGRGADFDAQLSNALKVKFISYDGIANKRLTLTLSRSVHLGLTRQEKSRIRSRASICGFPKVIFKRHEFY
jgi:hypothetical protein